MKVPVFIGLLTTVAGMILVPDCGIGKGSLVMAQTAATTGTGTLVIPPGPGDLSTVEHLKQSDEYVVEVKRAGDTSYKTCFVYKSDNSFVNTYFGASTAKPGPKKPQASASFTNFSFAKTAVDVRITSKIPVSSVTIRPLNVTVDLKQTGNVITFSLATPRKLSVEINDRLNPLFLFADTPDVPNPNATYYYGPGVHNIGLNKVLNTNESVYMAGGAVVEGSFRLATGSTNVSIKGRGVLSMGEWPHTATSVEFLTNHSTIRSGATANMVLEGFIIAHSTGWTIAIDNRDNKSHDNQYRNLKLVCWNGNSDGIWFDGDNNVVDDCFIFNNDDIVTTHGSNNCKISNIVAWGGPWGRLFMHTDRHSSANLTFEHIDMIGKDGGPELVLVEGNRKNPVTLDNFTFRNIRVEAHPKTSDYSTNKFVRIGVNPEKYAITLTNWLFENITLDDKNPDEGDIYGTAEGPVNGVTFRNLNITGKPVHSLQEANMDANKYVRKLTFE